MRRQELLERAIEILASLPRTAPYSNPTTSRQAAKRMAPFLTPRRLQVYDHILRAGERGVEDTEGAEALGLEAGRQYSPRRKDLVDAGLVLDSGQTRKTPRGHDATVWVVNPDPDPVRVEATIKAKKEEAARAKGITIGDYPKADMALLKLPGGLSIHIPEPVLDALTSSLSGQEGDLQQLQSALESEGFGLPDDGLDEMLREANVQVAIDELGMLDW